ncbi:MAG: hypothetical protein FIB07_14860 [Candidatus Methanoperedens sp.]|nr:hypothetical protein [Candidatus Methanoperedens sp.]
MKKENLQYTLQILAGLFENTAEKSHIEEFKTKYKGVRWRGGVKNSLLDYAKTKLAMQIWIENLINFMKDKGIILTAQRIW